MNVELLYIIVYLLTYIIAYPIFYWIFSKLADAGKMDVIFDKMDKIADKFNPNYDIENKLEKLSFVFKAQHYHDSKDRVRVFIGIANNLFASQYNTLNRFLKKRGYNLEWIQYLNIDTYDKWIFKDKYKEGTTLCLSYTKGKIDRLD